jgi:two-component system chemotaxis sensor kinase CheA
VAPEIKEEQVVPGPAVESAAEAGARVEAAAPAAAPANAPAASEPAETPAVAEEGSRQQGESRGNTAAQDSTIRVNVTVLDRLMTLVGELVLARNQLLQFANTLSDSGFHTISQHMNLIATELQEEVMKTRMQPIGNVWSKFPRTVRDLVVSCGKEVRIEMEGKETELDKTIIEAIKDPLTHLVRNSVDHGIELPDVRVKAGKDPVGVLTLRAFHEGGQVNIEISDDGAGLNLERLRSKAVERGVISAEQAARMQEQDIFNLIFLPGFSTAEKVTKVSGRGVGMDVVRTNIERIGGTVQVQSTAGKGTSIRVKIPLTLAIIPALVVTCAGDQFAIPQVALTELVSLEAGNAKGGIEMVHGAPVYRLRGQLLPLLYLRRELGIEAETAKQASGAVNIVVLRVDSRQFGLVVDEINDTEEIVVKPLRKQLKNVKTFAGASIMGDGRVALILDVPGLAQRANLGARTEEMAEQVTKSVEAAGDTRQTLLLFEGKGQSRMAIALSSVARLEEFAQERVEQFDGQEVVQYRGQILPLIRVGEIVRGSARFDQDAEGAKQTPLEVVVYTEQGRSVGLVVDHILDIVEENVALEHRGESGGVLGAAVVQQKVTELLDVAGVVRATLPRLFEERAGV